MSDVRPDFTRHSGFVHPTMLSEYTLQIVGCGATGSNVAELAARMGFTKFELWDADAVEPHNLPNQKFFPIHVGKNKAEALAEVIKMFNPDAEVITHAAFFDKDSEFENYGPLVLTTDSFASRRLIMEAAQDNVMIDGVFETALGFNSGKARFVDNLDESQVESYLTQNRHNDEDIPEGPCNLRTCPDLVANISSFLVNRICSKLASDFNGTDSWKPFVMQVFNMDPTEHCTTKALAPKSR